MKKNRILAELNETAQILLMKLKSPPKMFPIIRFIQSNFRNNKSLYSHIHVSFEFFRFWSECEFATLAKGENDHQCDLNIIYQ